MPQVHVNPTPSTGSAAADQAFSRGLLERVARGELDGAIRIWAPEPALALSRLDELRPGADAARGAAARAGIESVRRLSGGHAVVLGAGSICVGFAEPAETFAGTDARYERLTRALVNGLAALDVAAEHGELAGEWCPGSWSVRAGGVKLAGLAQRAIKGAAWVDAVVDFAPDAASRDLLRQVYAALELPLDMDTVTSVTEIAARDIDFDEFAQPVLTSLLA